ncbi:four-carbon acid sugar kinase family protein [Aurantimonas sp. 22II-16-19i]|uniref:four-carbon acid sugar kinase family protein n=1 Tax=Aurantimonas sp. 22II-16-19i TaxID=1317114 RepID=UPI0009F7CCD2|nr:four-carbon acid sugar kinase family protein [Aurantimonas sp. 22II-16-19i]ORE98425.1 Hrp-dependent type III effector protein [Aurantimonas sp. 22II-16-19i]
MNEDDAAAPWITWFGDDFTGSAAVMEVLAFAGVPSVLFTRIPDAELLRRFAGCRAIGIASTARSHSPAWMAEHLAAPLRFLDGLGAPLLHYKVCSTFDSAPDVGSIGKAIEIGLGIRKADAVPMIVAAPQMRRWQAFGHLFAGSLDGVFRLDRHPVMAHHPVTPMDEADLLRHLSAQSDLPSALIDLEALWSGPQQRLNEALAAGAKILSLDMMEERSEAAAGRLIWENRDRLSFVVGSQGVEYALVRHWQATDRLAAAAAPGSAGRVDRIAAISGSVSPTTAAQLRWAGANGFELIGFDAAAVCGGAADLAAEEALAAEAACEAAGSGKSPLVHSAIGEGDAVTAFRSAVSRSGISMETANQRIGEALGRILSVVLERTGLRRAVISGGDTSGHGMRQLGLDALTALAPTIPGAALCSAHGESRHDGLQIALKGGQMGSEDFFGWIRDGGGARS